MAYLDGYYLNNPHVSQFDGSAYAGSNCTPASGANGINAVTFGRVTRTGAQVRSLVKRTEETNPSLPGWNLDDLALALRRLYPPLPLTISTGKGWSQLVADGNDGQYLIVQGIEKVFTKGCAGSFDGPHCIGVHPARRTNPDTGKRQAWTDNPLCPTGKWENMADIQSYAMLLNPTVFYASMGHVRKQVTLWGSDVPKSLKLYNPTGWTVGQAVKEVNGGFGSVINMSDLELALDNIHHDYGDRIDPSDLQVLVDHVK